MLLVYDDGKRDQAIEGRVTFWVVPWRLVLGGIMTPILPALFVYLFMKWRMKRYYKLRKY